MRRVGAEPRAGAAQKILRAFSLSDLSRRSRGSRATLAITAIASVSSAAALCCQTWRSRCCSSPHNPPRIVIPTDSAGAVATKEEWRDPDTVYFTMLIQGISTRISVAGLAFPTSPACPACPGTAVGRSRGSRAIMAITAIVSASSAVAPCRETWRGPMLLVSSQPFPALSSRPTPREPWRPGRSGGIPTLFTSPC